MKRLWLLFAQVATVTLAVWFVVGTLKPGWLPQAQGPALSTRGVVPVIEAPQAAAGVVPAGSLRHAAQKASVSVVSINTGRALRNPNANDPWRRFFFGNRVPQQQQQAQTGLGSGVIVSPGGVILTNNHVVEGADEIEVVLADGRQFLATVVGTDPESDLAVLKVDAGDLPAVTLGNSDQLAVGDQVLAIGNPFGVGQTVTSGIVSALGRNHLGINTFENFIQTDAAINPGNSGGALVNIEGQLIGINTAIYSRSGGNMGIGFAIPMTTARQVMDSIVKNGVVTRGWIGVEPNELTPELAQTFGLPAPADQPPGQPTKGVVITGVLQGGPAALAGIRPGDVIVSVAGKPVGNVSELLSAVAALKPGETAPFGVLRREGSATVDVKPGVRPRARRQDTR
ncbi:MAG TPA: trypsin-like peptidase domain-containing protein [Burkholderiaceae bacterium]|nr:trypsin-like peptidase domain-containing protein [Burkholderiaceae bacterium]